MIAQASEEPPGFGKELRLLLRKRSGRLHELARNCPRYLSVNGRSPFGKELPLGTLVLSLLGGRRKRGEASNEQGRYADYPVSGFHALPFIGYLPTVTALDYQGCVDLLKNSVDFSKRTAPSLRPIKPT